ncbi:type II toxin-antitoxin system HipA family toxin [Pseudomonas fluorescens]|uniref:Type II toxin-antitoxin system HipA family toxin n=1 Tax=Pseudomonas fluorescens TaxID=294 RepID=A0A944DQQ1_PSEFL|nr:type II toxin-antitoxin system HipA family toxin [Pseudomonas fluorescens]MBT2298373.1 type II toxin-antitoxin system HipA family toxin [Pseudomonas fluorescens]MBT2310565.1 type II toxin-antitoxin system HipA family toxin [Pseudomonas fluorescens]MBT2310923.1 type II toxin-antitoxin system HipA family toxin [Pseudomonas fluorescens]MBT2320506.1 type II toxin-antitoxin system HipA family toxin [Pseudomonas fluorescens]MBT2331095.1 type II toxin-antitoxin system HipA family toxin [Pseudomona
MVDEQGLDRLQVCVGETPVGILGRGQQRSNSVFTYATTASEEQSVSLTMPVRLESYTWESGVLPIFEMNLPEGALRDELVRRFSKAVRGFDDFAMLAIVGPHQLGRVGVGPLRAEAGPPETSLEDLLVHDGAEGLFDDLLHTYGQYSGVSGVQPKVLVRDSASTVDRLTHRGATHLIKAFRADEFPELAANEFFCMRAALHAGLEVPEFELSERGKFLIIKRFDLADTGEYLGFEDFCVLNGSPSRAKYDGSYEGAARQIKAFVSPHLLNQALESLFKIVALSAGLKNGDAHLKNFGVLYGHCGVDATIRLAPAYDIVTTAVYIRNDNMALLLGGSKAWPKYKMLMRFGRSACNLTEGRCKELMEQVIHGMDLTLAEMRHYIAGNKRFKATGEAMIKAWTAGLARSLKPSAA